MVKSKSKSHKGKHAPHKKPGAKAQEKGRFTEILGGEKSSVYAKLKQLGLASNLQMFLAAGDLNSYPGHGKTWSDISGNDCDFSLVGGAGPAFSGRPGGLSANEYFLLDGASYFTLIGSNPAWVNDLHRKNPHHTLIAWIYPGSGAFNILGSMNGASAPGIQWRVSRGMQHHLVAGNGKTNHNLSPIAGQVVLTPNAWNFVALSLDPYGVTFQTNAEQGVRSSSYVAPSSDDASSVLKIGVRGDVSEPMSAGTKVSVVAGMNVALPQAKLSAIFDATHELFRA